MTLRERILSDIVSEHGPADVVALEDALWPRALADAAETRAKDDVLIFDAASRDHVAAASRADGVRRDERGIGSLELAQAATARGLSLRAVIPYGAFLGSGQPNCWLTQSRLWGYLGDRALSWLDTDARLLAFAVFVERHIVGALSTAAGSRFAAVFEKRSDAAMTAAALAANRPQDLRQATWMAELRAHLSYPRSRALAAMMLCAPASVRVRQTVEALVGAQCAADLYDGYERARADAAVEKLLLELRGPSCEISGVDVSSALTYDCTRDLLERSYFSARGIS